jgi:hypothetical protein
MIGSVHQSDGQTVQACGSANKQQLINPDNRSAAHAYKTIGIPTHS